MIYVLLALMATLVLAQLACGRLARWTTSRMMRPAEDLDPEDVDRWLDLIEPFPLPEQPRKSRR